MRECVCAVPSPIVSSIMRAIWRKWRAPTLFEHDKLTPEHLSHRSYIWVSPQTGKHTAYHIGKPTRTTNNAQTNTDNARIETCTRSRLTGCKSQPRRANGKYLPAQTVIGVFLLLFKKTIISIFRLSVHSRRTDRAQLVILCRQ